MTLKDKYKNALALGEKLQIKDGYVTENGLNINLANRDQLAVYLAVFFPDLSPLKCNEIVKVHF